MTRRMRGVRWRGAAALIAIVAGAAPAFGQEAEPGQEPVPEQDREQARQDEQDDDRSLKQQIERRLERLRDQQLEYEKALALLSEGASETRVRELLGDRDHDGHDWERGGPDKDRGDRHDDDGRGRRDDRRELSTEETQRVLAFIEEHFPSLSERMSGLTPEVRERMAERFAPRFFEVERADARDATLGVLKLDELKAGFGLLESIGAYRRALKDEAGSAELNAAKRRIRQALQVQFDAQQASKRREVELLDARVGELERELAEREAERNAILDDKLEDITSSIARRDERRRRRGG